MTASIAEPSTWAMTTLGFAGVAFVDYRRSRTGGRSARKAPPSLEPLQNVVVFSFPRAVS